MATKKTDNSRTIEMKHEKSTKGTHVYRSEGGAVRSLYVEKEDMPKEPPASITLTVTW
jgi:hypothetical protein